MKFKRIGTELSIIIVIGILATSIIMSFIAINISSDIVEELVGEKAMSIAISAANYIDGDAFEELVETQDESLPYYMGAQQWLYQLLQDTETTYLYTMIEHSSTEYMYIIEGSDEYGTEGFLHLGDLDDKENYSEEPIEVLNDGVSRYSAIYDAGQWGFLISAFAPIKNSDGKVVGIVGCDVNADTVNEIANNFIVKMTIGVLIILLVFVAVFIFLIQKIVTKPIGRVVEYAARLANKKYAFDMDAKLLNRLDEVGVLVNEINNVKNQTSEVLLRIVHSSETLVESSKNLSVVSVETAKSIDEVSRSINDIADNATTQAHSSEEGYNMTNELQKFVDENTGHIEALVTASDKMNELVNEGKATIDDVMLKSDETSNAIKNIQDKLEITSKSSEQISQASGVIASIADQTNLLALNAAIEAARAGEHGKGFAVVADEIRMLAEQSASSTQEIDGVVKELLNNLRETVSVMDEVVENTDAQRNSVEVSLDKYNQIDGGIVNTQENIGYLTSSSDKIVMNTKNLQNVVSQITNIAEENAANTEEVSAATEEQNASMQEVSSSSSGLSDLAKELKRIVDTFELE